MFFNLKKLTSEVIQIQKRGTYLTKYCTWMGN